MPEHGRVSLWGGYFNSLPCVCNCWVRVKIWEEIGAIGGFKCVFGIPKDPAGSPLHSAGFLASLRVYVFGELFQLTDALQSMLRRG